jgi:hypothetical protein
LHKSIIGIISQEKKYIANGKKVRKRYQIQLYANPDKIQEYFQKKGSCLP